MAENNDRDRTVMELLNAATNRLREAGVENPRLDAELLLAEATGRTRAELLARAEQALDPPTRRRFLRLALRRAAREPLQYLLGKWEFYGRSFFLSPAVLVPRPETEVVVEACLEKLFPGEGRWAADVGTGSGVIALTLALERPELRVIATDTDQEALEIAALNAEKHGARERVHFARGDLTAPVPRCLPDEVRGLDLLVSNPPYVPTGRLCGLQPEVSRFEPRRALDGGPDGLSVIRRLIPSAGPLLLPGGWLVLEIGGDQAARVAELIRRTGEFEPRSIEVRADAAGKDRVICARRGDG